MRVSELDAGNGESSAHAAGAEDELRRFESKSAFGLDRVRAGEAGRADLLVDRHAEHIDSFAEGRVRAYLVHDFAHAREQPVELQRRLARGDAVPGQMPRVVHQPRGKRQSPHRHGPIVGGHPAELRGGHNCRARAEFRGTDRGEHARRSGADHDDVVDFRRKLAGRRHDSRAPEDPEAADGDGDQGREAQECALRARAAHARPARNPADE